MDVMLYRYGMDNSPWMEKKEREKRGKKLGADDVKELLCQLHSARGGEGHRISVLGTASLSSTYFMLYYF